MFEDEIPVGKARDLRGMKFHYLTVLYRTHNSGRKVMWKCKCKCGNELAVRQDCLTSGNTKSCGCWKSEKNAEVCAITGRNNAVDITGMRFNKLVAIRPTDERLGTNVKWECQCDCGNIHLVAAKNLLSGQTQSCGCLLYHDIKNQRFGKLIALEPTNQRQEYGGSVMWRCKCDCGNEILASTAHLTRGGVSSCGCLISRGEEKVRQLLSENNIYFTTQKTFDSCRIQPSNMLARFDFYIQDKYLIEYDGEQHFFYSNSGWNDAERFEKTQASDAYKNQWCKDNNIPLIRIPYTKLDTLCIEDLLLETTQFKVN